MRAQPGFTSLGAPGWPQPPFPRHRQLIGRRSRRWVMMAVSRGNRDAGDLGPDREGLRACGSVLGGGDVIAAEMKEVVDLVVGGEESLRLAGRLEPLHLPFSSSCRLV